MTGRTISVMLVDDHSLIRQGLRTMVEAENDMRVVCEAGNGMQALEMFRREKPDVVIMDISLPDYNGLQVASQVLGIAKELGIESKVVILSMYAKASLVDRALQAGAYGYVSKCASPAEVIHAIRRAHEGSHYLCPKMAALIIPEYIRQKSAQDNSEAYNLLTPREQEIFRLLVEGHSNQSIGRLLSISQKTVQRHRANLTAKLGVHSYRELLHYGIKIGLFEPVDDLID